MTGVLTAPAVSLAAVGALSFVFQLLQLAGHVPYLRVYVNVTLCGVQHLGPVFSLVTLLGGIQMARGRSYRLAVAGSVLAAIPFCNVCCGVSTAVGLWALSVLKRPEVKAGFEARAAPG